MIRALFQSVLLTLFLIQTGFAYNLVDVDPAQRAVDPCGEGLNSKYPDAVFDAENANVRGWMLPSHPHDFTIYEVSISFTNADRSGVWIMRAAVSPVPQLPILNYGTSKASRQASTGPSGCRPIDSGDCPGEICYFDDSSLSGTPTQFLECAVFDAWIFRGQKADGGEPATARADADTSIAFGGPTLALRRLFRCLTDLKLAGPV